MPQLGDLVLARGGITFVKVEDKEGHKHDDLGRFSATSGHAKPGETKPKKAPKPAPTEPLYGGVTTNIYGKSDGFDGTDTHAGETWNGTPHPDYGDGQNQTKRWDAPGGLFDSIKEHLLNGSPEQKRDARHKLEHIHLNMMLAVQSLEGRSPLDSTAKISLKKREAARVKHRALYFDANRVDALARMADYEAGAGRHVSGISLKMLLDRHQRTAPLAEAIATKKPKSIADALALGKKMGFAWDREVAEQYFLWKHSVHLIDKQAEALPTIGVYPPGQARFRDEGSGEPTLGDLQTRLKNYEYLDNALAPFGAKFLSATPVSLSFEEPKEGGGWAGLAQPLTRQCIIGTTPDSGKFHTEVIAHEMSHAASYGSLFPEYRAFKEWMNDKMRSSKPLATPDDPELGRKLRAWGRLFLTSHGVNSDNYQRHAILPGERQDNLVDPQEDWAICLSTELAHGRNGIAAKYEQICRDSQPRVETVEKLSSLLGMKPVQSLDNLRSMNDG